MRIDHNPRCRKSRESLAILEEAGVEIEIVRYLDDPPTADELDGILRRLDLDPTELMRKGETLYRELGLRERSLARDEAIRLMVENPKLIERPIVVDGDRAVIGRPPERVRELL